MYFLKIMTLFLPALSVVSSCSNAADEGSSVSSFEANAQPNQWNWISRDVGGGGAVGAMAVGPYSYDPKSESYDNTEGDVFLGSDMSGVYSIPDGKDEFVARYTGLAFTKISKDPVGDYPLMQVRGSAIHIQGLETVGEPDQLTFAVASGGVIYRSRDRGGHWEVVFDVEIPENLALFETKADKVTLGPIAILGGDQKESSTIIVGVGQPKHLRRGREKGSAGGGSGKDLLKVLPTELRFTVLISEDSGLNWQRVKLCKNDCPSAKRDLGHVIAISSSPKNRQFWVATLGGIFQLKKSGKGWLSTNKSKGAPGKPASWSVLSVQPNPRDPNDVLILTADTAKAGLLWHTKNADAKDIVWKDVTDPAFSKLTPVGEWGVFAKLMRSKSRPSELILAGTKNDEQGVWMTKNFSDGGWKQILSHESVDSFAQGGWTRFDVSKTARFQGTGEMTFTEDKNGIRSVYVSGFAGMVVRSDRVGDTMEFKSRQIYSKQLDTSPGEPSRITSNGHISLGSSKGGAHLDSSKEGNGPQVFLYGDNGAFISHDQGASFTRPIQDWFYGTDAAIFGDRVAIGYAKGNHLENSKDGGVQYSADNGKSFTDISGNGLPAAAVTQVVLGQSDPTVFALAQNCGIFVTTPKSGDAPEWTSFSEGLPEFKGNSLKCSSKKVTPIDLEYLKEAQIDGAQVLLVSHKERSSDETGLYFRIPSRSMRKWKKVTLSIDAKYKGYVKDDRFKHELFELHVRDNTVVGLTEENVLLLGKLTLDTGSQESASIDFREVISAPLISVEKKKGKRQTVQVDIQDVTICGQSIYAATAEGAWRLPLGKQQSREWISLSGLQYKPLWKIATDQACNLFVGADGSGFYFLKASPL